MKEPKPKANDQVIGNAPGTWADWVVFEVVRVNPDGSVLARRTLHGDRYLDVTLKPDQFRILRK